MSRWTEEDQDVMSDFAQGSGWWLASDGMWYPPELHPDQPRVPVQVSQVSSPRALGTSDAAAVSYWDTEKESSAAPSTTTFIGSQETNSTPSSSKSGRGRLVGVLAVVGVAVVLVVSLVVVLGGSTAGLSGKTATQVLAVTVAAAKSQGSVHLGDSNTSGPAGGGSYDVSANGGQQTVLGGTQGDADLLVVPGHGYLKGDAAFCRTRSDSLPPLHRCTPASGSRSCRATRGINRS